MNMLLPLIILLILGCIYAGSLKTPSSRLCVVVCILIIILTLCYFQMQAIDINQLGKTIGKTIGLESFESGYAPLEYTMQNGNSYSNGYNYGDVNSQMGSTGTYDGIRFKTNTINKPLISDPMFWSPTGDGYILKDSMNSENFPSIDGQKGSPRSMFVLKNSDTSWDCCGSSPFSGDGNGGRGCPCISKEQMDMFAGRSGNRTLPVEYPGM